MAQQNINQYVYPNWGLNFALESYDMSLTSDERGYNEEVVFSPYLIAQTYGNRLPFYFDINNPLSVQDLTLTYKDYNRNNIFVSQNFYNPNELDITCFKSHTSCDIGLTGIDNGLVTKMTGETITFTEGLFSDDLKFNRMYFDRRLKLFQVTGNTQSPNVRFSGFNKTVLYEVVSKYSPFEGRYHELYGGFYQGFYKLFGYDYEIFPERMNRGWSVEMLLKPRLSNEYIPTSGETTLNKIYPQNKNIFFYLGARAENKFYHYANGTPNCFTGYTRVTSDLYNCIQTCACCNRTVTDSRCIYVYPPRSLNGIHDPHVNYGCHECRGIPEQKITCGCNCNLDPCESCGWECQTHTCASIIEPTPTPTPTPTSTPTNCVPTTPTCTETCSDCNPCYDFGNCITCLPTGFTSVEYTCETNPLFDVMSNALSFKLCGDPKNPQIGVKVLRFTGGCETSGTCSTSGLTYTTGYTVTEYCSPGGIYPTCYTENPAWLDEEHWFQLDAVWERYTWLDDCDLWYRGGLGIITQEKYLESLAHNSVSLITIPYTSRLNIEPAKIELVNLNERWLEEEKYRRGRLKIYINGKIFYTIEDFQEIIPRALSTDKEKQVGVPFNISWGGGTQGLRENLTFSSCTLPNGPYQQDPECFPVNDLTGTTFNGMNTNIVIEQNFAGTFEGGISQFRMYVTPLSAPEVKHNFNILKNTFRMFNPDCPDCSTEICPPDDFTYTIGDISTTTTTTIPVTTTTTTIPVTTTTTTTNENTYTFYYTSDNTTIFANPERGLQKYSKNTNSDGTYRFINQSQITGWRIGVDKVTVIYRYVMLTEFINNGSVISDTYLSNLQTDFDRIRNAGLKVIIRPAYTVEYASIVQPNKQTILNHITQLSSVINLNDDIIVSVQSGFIGVYGEWYYTGGSVEFGDEGTISPAQWLNRKDVVDSILSNFNSSIPTQVRYANAKREMYGNTTLNDVTAYQNTPTARVGFYNDAFLNNYGDMGTYDVSICENPFNTVDYNFIANSAQYLPMNGESNGLNSCNSGFRTTGGNAVVELNALNFSTLNRDYSLEVWGEWILQGYYDEIVRNLGYRLQLNYITLVVGETIDFTMNISNVGYGNILTPKNVYLIFKNSLGVEYPKSLTVDPRFWTSTQTISQSLVKDIPNGQYDLFLHISDINLESRPEYSIRLANSDITFNNTTGYNDLLSQVTITNSPTII